MIDDNSKATGDGSGDSDSDSGLNAYEKEIRKKGGQRKADVVDEDEEDEEHEEPKAPGAFVPANLLVILIAGVLSSKCEP